jgi:coenzyme F420-reducing hydrogenase gamma subunit
MDLPVSLNLWDQEIHDMKKLKIGWFSFSCCEDSTILFTELLNDHYLKWKKLIDFQSILIMQRKEVLEDLDVAFVEGAITSKEQEEKLKTIRGASKKLVAIGSCACSGLPAGQRNDFDPSKKAEIEFLLTRFSYAQRVQKLSDIVVVDDQVSGCPMSEESFLAILDKYLKEFEIIAK